MTSTTSSTPEGRAFGAARRSDPARRPSRAGDDEATRTGHVARTSIRQLVASGAGLVVVLLVGLLVAPLHGWTAAELSVDQWFSARHTAALDAVAGVIGTVVSPPVGFGLLVVLCVVAARRIAVRRAVVLLGIAGATLAGGVVLKLLVHRPRPDVSLLASPPPVDTSFSYPSGHTTVATVLVVTALAVLARHNRRWAVPVGVLLVAVVAVSRVYLGLHYPLDVVAAAGYAVCGVAFLSALATTTPLRRVLSVVHLDTPDPAPVEPAAPAPTIPSGPVAPAPAAPAGPAVPAPRGPADHSSDASTGDRA